MTLEAHQKKKISETVMITCINLSVQRVYTSES